MCDVDGAVEQRPVLTAGADAIDELLHHALVLAAQRGSERAEIDARGSEVELALTRSGAGKRDAQAAGEVRRAESGGDPAPAQLGWGNCRGGCDNMDRLGEVGGADGGVIDGAGG